MAVSTTSTNSANLHSYYVKKALSVMEPRLQLYKLGKKTPLPAGNGKEAKWLLYTTIAGSTSALTEGTNPNEIAFTTANVTATVAQYGQYSKVSDQLKMTAIDPVLESLSERFGHAARKSIELLIAAELDGALTVRRVNGRANDDAILSTDVPTLKEFLKCRIALQDSLVGPHESGSYVAVLHNNNEYDILSQETQISWQDFRSFAAPDKDGAMKGEIGRLLGMRFIVSDLMSEADNATPISVKNNYVIGEECFGVVELGKKGSEGFEIIIKPHDSGGQANPLNMFATCGYKIQGFKAKNFAANRGILLKGATSFS
jgi:N4-gp56 family major capsid protein